MNLKQFKKLIGVYNDLSSEWNSFAQFYFVEEEDNVFILFTDDPVETNPIMLWMHVDYLIDALKEVEPSSFNEDGENFLSLEKFQKFVFYLISPQIKFKHPFVRRQV